MKYIHIYLKASNKMNKPFYLVIADVISKNTNLPNFSIVFYHGECLEKNTINQVFSRIPSVTVQRAANSGSKHCLDLCGQKDVYFFYLSLKYLPKLSVSSSLLIENLIHVPFSRVT